MRKMPVLVLQDVVGTLTCLLRKKGGPTEWLSRLFLLQFQQAAFGHDSIAAPCVEPLRRRNRTIAHAMSTPAAHNPAVSAPQLKALSRLVITNVPTQNATNAPATIHANHGLMFGSPGDFDDVVAAPIINRRNAAPPKSTKLKAGAATSTSNGAVPAVTLESDFTSDHAAKKPPNLVLVRNALRVRSFISPSTEASRGGGYE
jgi:hypothetical protein